MITPLTFGASRATLRAAGNERMNAISAQQRAHLEGMRVSARRNIAWCNAQPWRGNPGLRALRRQWMSALQWCNRLLGERD